MAMAYWILSLLLTGVSLQVININVDDNLAVDVYFLADNTGSMSKEIVDVKDQAKFIFNQLAAQIGSENIKFGVGAYKDFGDNFVFKNFLNLTYENLDVAPDQDPIVLAMGEWEASGGGSDLPESQLYALYQIASVEYESIGWRESAVKIIVWFGDAPGHDPNTRTANRKPITEQFVTDALVQKDIRVSAIDVQNMDETGQASRIAGATNGDFQKSSRKQGDAEGTTPNPITIPQAPAPPIQDQSTRGQDQIISPPPAINTVSYSVENEVPIGEIQTGLLQFNSSDDTIGVNVSEPVDPFIINTQPQDPYVFNQESVVFETTLIPEETDLAVAIVASVTGVVNQAINF
eukprot:TRINITY_DN6553_c0_g1_i1.p1 TRINITY_DN6553_c0_g1~~TRINITY_DN6553_c0_g1_i1.p1  ORF type:complete len:348 (+),score=71.11 TRINITY_DN6553_c0_g1_i1:136-1179(+)